MALLAGPVGVIAAFLLCYAVHGAANPVHVGLLHRQVDGPYRASVLSLNSMVGQPGSALGAVVLTAIAAQREHQRGDADRRGRAGRGGAALPGRPPAGPGADLTLRGRGVTAVHGGVWASTPAGYVRHKCSHPSEELMLAIAAAVVFGIYLLLDLLDVKTHRPVQLPHLRLARPAAALALPGRHRQRPARHRHRWQRPPLLRPSPGSRLTPRSAGTGPPSRAFRAHGAGRYCRC